MLSIEQAKQMAKSLRTSLQARNLEVTHAIALELVARQLGYKDWNTASARLPEQNAAPAVTFDRPIPILRMFDEAKAREFYLDFLGFSVEFEHRFEADLPLYWASAAAACSCIFPSIMAMPAPVPRYSYPWPISNCCTTS